LLSPVISEFDANRNRAFLGKHGDGREENTEFAFIDNPNGLFEEYLNQKALTKTILEKNHGNSENGENLLDRHKIAACVTVAIMKMRLLYLKYIDDKNNDYTLSKAKKVNEQLAFLSGLHVVFAFMAMEDSKTIDLSSFRFPGSHNPDKSTYFDSTIRALYYTNTVSGFQTLLLSNIFFLLEEYHKLSCTKQ
jgi:hypothetical protein